MRRIFPLLVVSALLLACQAKKDDPWIVTGLSVTPGDVAVTVVAEYTAPNGRTGSWRGIGNPLDAQNARITFTCWQSAKVGEPLPDCMKTTGALFPSTIKPSAKS